MTGPEIDGVVFDFDGLILDTERPVFAAWQEAFAEHGCPPLTLDEWAKEIGTSGGLDLVELIRTRATVPFDEEAMHARRRRRRDQLLMGETARPGVKAWLDEADQLGLPLAIASSSPLDWVEPHLERLGLLGRFAFIACFGGEVSPGAHLARTVLGDRYLGGRVLAGKPAPDTYLAACAAIGVKPAAALAIEDSPHGVSAAKAAGLWCVAVPHEITEQLDLSHADLRLGSLADATMLETIGRLA
jgi:beta-phosphoglucomutase-like phosphatase (HAD superfamily)